MSQPSMNEPMLELYIYETSQLIGQLEHIILNSEENSCYTPEAINEIFRITHTIKGASAMMLFSNISALAHAIEDLFYFLREQKPQNVDCADLSDLVLESVDFVKVEVHKIKNGDGPDGDAFVLIERIKEMLSRLKQTNPASQELESNTFTDEGQQYYVPGVPSPKHQDSISFKAVIYFDDECGMENIRAFSVIHNLKDIAEEIHYLPKDIIDNDDSILTIRNEGFQVFFKTGRSYKETNSFLMQTPFLKDLMLVELEQDGEFEQFTNQQKTVIAESPIKIPQLPGEKEQHENLSATQSMISVHVNKLDKLMDLVGEMVIAEAMVTQNPDLLGLELENFQKSARQLRKIVNELQDMVMSIRMVPLTNTFHKMHRIVRDMSKKLHKEVTLQVIGEDTEVDKNIIEHISDPLMHLVRNAIDHGLESTEERLNAGKPRIGTVTLEARNAGSDVLISVKDDGRGLHKEKILTRAREHRLLNKHENEMSDQEIYNLILLTGFSTKDNVTEFSGRGVGMDVVARNIEAVGGSVLIDSGQGSGTVITLKVALTLAIIDGMNIRVGASRYTVPTLSIKESFKPKESDVISDPNGNEMIMVRGQCYPILRLHQLYKVHTDVVNLTEGILIMVEQDGKCFCIFADELLGQQQIVVKALPDYIKKIKKVRGLAGCTLLGDGSISLILDISGLMGTNGSLYTEQ